MFAKVLILALALGANAVQIGYGGLGYGSSVYGAGLGLTGGVPVYRSSANYGGLLAANGWGYGANLGRVAGLGALRTTGAIVGGGAIGYGSGAYLAGAPAVSTVGLGHAYGLNAGLGHLNVARGVSVHQAGPVNAAVQTISRTVDYRPVPYTGEAPVVQDIDVPPQESPLRINFQSKSSPLAVTQQHIPAEPGQTQVTQSEDEPQTAIHNVVRPVHQQVNELIQPYRTLTQTVEPVIEQSHTNIAQGEGVRLTGLTSGVVGGTGVIAASGLGVAAPAIAVNKVGVAGLGYGLNAGLGYGVAGLRTAGLGYGVAAPAIAVNKVAGLGYGLNAGLGYGAVRSVGLSNAGLYGTGIVRSGLVGSTGYGLGLNGLSGLSGYGTTAKIARFAY